MHCRFTHGNSEIRKFGNSVANGLCITHRFIRESYIIEPACQNFRLTDLCLTYLTFDCLKFDLGEDKVQQSVLNGDYSFLEYSANNWLNHLRDLGLHKERLGPERYLDIRRKTKAVLDLHRPGRVLDYTPAADIARYFRAFSDCAEIYLHPTLRDEAHLSRRSGEGSSPDPSIIQLLTADSC